MLQHLSVGERLGELLFGLIMTLTFTLGASVVFGTGEGASTELLYATIGCNIAWGVIDGALLIFGRLFDRGRLARLGRAIASASDERSALAVVSGELDETLASISSERQRLAFYRDVIERVRSSRRRVPQLTRDDLFAAISVFCLVFFASLPAALPYFLIDDAWFALRASNALLIGILFFVGFRWAKYTSFKPLVAACVLVALGITLVLIAIPLGG